MIKKFEAMFPRSLYVAKEENYDSITLRFDLYSPYTEEIVEYNEREFNKNSVEGIDACVYLVHDKISDNYGYLVILNEEKVDYGVCTHEATHVCKHMEDHFGLERDANEYRAYLTEWYSNRIAEVWNNNVNYP